MAALAFAIPILIPFFAAAAGGSLAPSGAAPDASSRRLDQAKAHQEYQDGNFEQVLSMLEGFQRAQKTYSREDSIFIAKHLAVVYTANPGTREKGKYYMNRLLELVPSAKLVDMYVSDEIDRIFEKVREEYLSRQRHFGVDPSTVRLPDRPPAQGQADPSGSGGRGAGPGKKSADTGKSSGRVWFWIAGGAVCIAGGAAYYILHDSPPSDKTYVVE